MSSREQQIYDICQDFENRNEEFPQIREIAAMLGVSYTAVHTYVGRLIEKGYLVRPTPRTLQIVKRGDA